MEKYIIKVKYIKTCEETGKHKKVSESYMFDAVNWTDAETKAYETLTTIIVGEFNITSINPVKFSDVITDEVGTYYYKCTVRFKMLNEATGREKLANYRILVIATDVTQAKNKIDELMQGVEKYEVSGITDTKIIDYYR